MGIASIQSAHACIMTLRRSRCFAWLYAALLFCDEISSRTKKVATMITPSLHRAFAILLKLDGGRTMDEFLRASIEDYVGNHRFSGSVAHLIKQDRQGAPESRD